MNVETAREGQSPGRRSPSRNRNVVLLISTLFGVMMQCGARVGSRFSGTNLQRRDNYLLLFIIGVVVMSTAIGTSIFVVLRRRLSGFAGGVVLSAVAAILVGAIVFFCGLYWPWLLGMY